MGSMGSDMEPLGKIPPKDPRVVRRNTAGGGYEIQRVCENRGICKLHRKRIDCIANMRVSNC